MAASNKQLEERFATTEQAFDPFAQAGFGGLEGLVQGSTAGGLDQRLGEIFGSQNFQNLRDERTRAVQGQLSAGGLTRSGTAVQDIANVPTDLGFQIEQLLSGRQGGLAGQGFNAVTNVGNLRQTLGQNIAGNLEAGGQAGASGILGAGQAEAQGTGNLLRGISSGLSSLFSDPKLKMNIKKIGKVKDLNMYNWEWIPETKGTMVEGSASIGFMADEVKKIYPQYVYNFAEFDIIDYPSLIEELERAA